MTLKSKRSKFKKPMSRKDVKRIKTLREALTIIEDREGHAKDHKKCLTTDMNCRLTQRFLEDFEMFIEWYEDEATFDDKAYWKHLKAKAVKKLD